MKKYILVIGLIQTMFSFSQEWKTISSDDISIFSKYFTLDKSTNSIWIGSEYGMKKIGNGIISSYYDVSSLSGMINFSGIKAIYVNNDVVFGLDWSEGLFKLENNSVDILNSDIVKGSGLFFGPQDTLWASTHFQNTIGIYGFNTDTYDFYNSNNSGLYNNSISNVIKDKYNRIWCSHFVLGVSYRKTDGNWQFDYPVNSDIDGPITKVVEDLNDGIWATGNKGLFNYDEVTENWIIYNKSNTNLPSEYITDVDFDRHGRTWVVMKDTAIGYSYNLTDWTIFDGTNSPLTYDINLTKEILIDTLDNVWVKDWNKLRVLSLDSFENTWLSVNSLRFNESSISIYPNPSEHIIIINNITEQEVTSVFYNIAGIEQVVNQVSENKFDVSQLYSGVYIVKIKSVNGIEIKRFVKK